jgi:hypothetical protein
MPNIPSSGIVLPLPSEPVGEVSDLDAAAAALCSRDAPADEALDPVEIVRMRLEIEDRVPDVTIAASLAQIGVRTSQRERWLAAFGSPLGKHLALRGGDLTTALDVLLAITPRSR